MLPPPPLTLIAAGTVVHGTIDAGGDITVSGRVDGGIRAVGLVVIEHGSGILGEVRGTRVRIDGAVIGPVTASERIEVTSGARVVGDLRAPAIEVAAGASIEGRLDQRVPEVEALPLEGRPSIRIARPLSRPSMPPRSGITSPPPTGSGGEDPR